MSAVLYRCHDAKGELLYLGCSLEPQKRFKSHRAQKSWWTDVHTITLEHFRTFEEAHYAENEALAHEHSTYNRASPERPLTEAERFAARVAQREQLRQTREAKKAA